MWRNGQANKHWHKGIHRSVFPLMILIEGNVLWKILDASCIACNLREHDKSGRKISVSLFAWMSFIKAVIQRARERERIHLTEGWSDECNLFSILFHHPLYYSVNINYEGLLMEIKRHKARRPNNLFSAPSGFSRTLKAELLNASRLTLKCCFHPHSWKKQSASVTKSSCLCLCCSACACVCERACLVQMSVCVCANVYTSFRILLTHMHRLSKGPCDPWSGKRDVIPP